jgi:hypothetical protein
VPTWDFLGDAKRHRDEDVARQYGLREPQLIESSESSLQRHLPDFIAIQIHEPDSPRL